MGSLTPLTFTWHCSGPLAFLLPVCTFFTMEGGDSEYEKFTVPTLKAFLKSQSVCQARNCCLCYRMPKYTLFPCNHDFLISWKKMQRHFSPSSITFPLQFLHTQQKWHLYCFTVLGSTSNVIHSVNENLSEIGPEVAAATYRDFLRKGLQRAFIHSCIPASSNCRILFTK